jgi:quinol monooxygenase YgiN
MIVGIVGSVKVRAEKTADFERVFRELTQKVRSSEPGNLVYQLVRVRGERGSYKMIEFYRDQAAYDQHAQAPYLGESLGQLMSCLDGAPRVELVESAD